MHHLPIVSFIYVSSSLHPRTLSVRAYVSRSEFVCWRQIAKFLQPANCRFAKRPVSRSLVRRLYIASRQAYVHITVLGREGKTREGRSASQFRKITLAYGAREHGRMGELGIFRPISPRLIDSASSRGRNTARIWRGF